MDSGYARVHTVDNYGEQQPFIDLKRMVAEFLTRTEASEPEKRNWNCGQREGTIIGSR